MMSDGSDRDDSSRFGDNRSNRDDNGGMIMELVTAATKMTMVVAMEKTTVARETKIAGLAIKMVIAAMETMTAPKIVAMTRWRQATLAIKTTMVAMYTMMVDNERRRWWMMVRMVAIEIVCGNNNNDCATMLTNKSNK